MDKEAPIVILIGFVLLFGSLWGAAYLIGHYDGFSSWWGFPLDITTVFLMGIGLAAIITGASHL